MIFCPVYARLLKLCAQFELNFVDLNPGYPSIYSTASTKNCTIPSDVVGRNLIYNLTRVRIDPSVRF